MPNHTQTNEYTKEQLHEAFTVEHRARVQLNKELNDERRYSKQLQYEKELYFDKWLRYHIKEHDHNLPDDQDMDECLDYYFNHPEHRTFMTESGGYYCVTREEDCVWVLFAWYNTEAWGRERKDMYEFLLRLQAYAQQPIRYTGKVNIMKNHSIEIEPGLWELKL